MTLVELLVVIVLLTTLVTTAIPIISPGGESRKLREASRGINSYLQGAQVRAMQTGRPFGVALRRLSADTGRGADNAVCAQLRYVEVPPAYAGFSETSVVRLARNPVYNPQADNNNVGDDDLAAPYLMQMLTRGPNTNGYPVGWAADLIPPRFFRPGDTVEIAGQRYTLVNSLSSTGALSISNDEEYFTPVTGGPNTFSLHPTDKEPLLSFEYDNQGRRLPDTAVLAAGANTTSPAGWTGAWPILPSDQPFWTEPKPYKIYRQPVEAGGEPLELPSGVAIDLQASAFGTIRANPTVGRIYSPHVDYDNSENEFTTVRQEDVMVLFAPEGNIHRVHGVVPTGGIGVGPEAASATSVTSYLALCVGRRELIPALRPDGLTTTTRAEYAEPIDLLATNVSSLSETEARELTDKYNWLNLESRWVVIGGPSGAITTVENSAVYPGPRTDLNGDNVLSVGEQIAAALENAPRRTSLGGR